MTISLYHTIKLYNNNIIIYLDSISHQSQCKTLTTIVERQFDLENSQ
jgi:hypothetical protein